jgi:dolichol-phosphate mannosyltransferase
MQMEQVDVSVVAPCYNEEESLPEFHRRVRDVCEKVGRPYEIVLVNDGSSDRTWDRMREAAAADPHLVLVDLSRNHGHQLALTAGLSVCRGDRILIIDADLQDRPELLPAMMEIMDQGVDVVYGQRRTREGESAFKLFTAAFFYRLIEKLTDTPIPRDTGDFRLMSRRALNILANMPERHRFIRGMVSWIGFRQEPLLYDRDKRFAGETKYPLIKMVRFAVDAITGFSIKPLALASVMGFVFACISICLLAYALAGWFFFRTVSGWTSLLVIVTLLGSVQLLVLGILGEYVGRLYEQSKNRPLFVIRSIVRSDSPDPH